MSSSEPRVSVGLPVYNGARFLARCLDSLLAQTFADFEIVISDNASTDETWQIVNAYAARDPRIRTVRQGENRGAAWNFEFVLQESKGEFFMWAAHDDAWSPNYMEVLHQALQKRPQAVLAYACVQGIDSKSTITSCSHEPPLSSRRNPFNVFFRPTQFWPRWYNALAYYLQPYGVMFYGLYRRGLLMAKKPLFVPRPGTIYDVDSRFLLELFFAYPVCSVSGCFFYYCIRERSPADYRSQTTSNQPGGDLLSYLMEAIPKSYGPLRPLMRILIRTLWTTRCIVEYLFHRVSRLWGRNAPPRNPLDHGFR